MSIRVSVIVPTFRRPRLLSRCLAALFTQDYDSSSYEIVVVEDAASQETLELIEAWVRYLETRPGDTGVQHRLGRHARNWRKERADGDGSEAVVPVSSRSKQDFSLSMPGLEERAPGQPAGLELQERVTNVARADAPCLRYIPLPDHRGPAAARNVGWQQAQGEIIAFTDDDCIPAPGWLRAGVAAFRPGVIAVSGRVVMPLSKVPTDYELNASNLERSEFVTANCFYRRAVLEHIGGFDERFAEAWREDSDLIFTIMERIDGPVQLEHASDAVVIHPVRPARWGISLLQQRKNMYNALLYKKHPSLYRQRLGKVTPWRYYIILIALLLCLAGLITNNPEIALGASMIWMALTGLFCAKRLERTSRSPQHVAEMAITSVLIPPVALYWRAKGALKYKVWFL